MHCVTKYNDYTVIANANFPERYVKHVAILHYFINMRDQNTDDHAA